MITNLCLDTAGLIFIVMTKCDCMFTLIYVFQLIDLYFNGAKSHPGMSRSASSKLTEVKSKGSQPTAALLVRAVQTVGLAITQHAGGKAAVPTAAAVEAELGGTVNLVRAVWAVRLSVTHLGPLDALPSPGTLELVCGQTRTTVI